MRRRGVTKVEAAYFCFITASIILSVFSYDKTESLKQIIKILALVFIFWQFIVLFRNANRTKLGKAFSAASLVFFSLTLLLYIIGLISLKFDFSTDRNVTILGVMVDRHMPRLISLSYYDPNLTAVFLYAPLVYYLSKHDSLSGKAG